ncbi:hypothetical protein HRR83_008716 [Exophiala dermatitidis]|uniref:Uncharacterized protein n=1 Tax=Exophiala dermatitidis TaxID=5970 RepID=A0AAN6ITM6_EXODE|nr:hypothetical protein HRR73_008531 [Exophiala dermatitidis]KAJ4505717.1 hypothetical protein HRR74_008628 [Exophiala dermatitidis]KAJ4536356.1 hypothetical protein HRR77_007277 [Exophiala dermatitidis]KAJ4541116.1 hypothetical protein HRR76_004492 [Exophiala dermatitidis]KAJ4559275.1 hypothetical protein HRR79_008298 [Exophiala dermatitidis]
MDARIRILSSNLFGIGSLVGWDGQPPQIPASLVTAHGVHLRFALQALEYAGAAVMLQGCLWVGVYLPRYAPTFIPLSTSWAQLPSETVASRLSHHCRTLPNIKIFSYGLVIAETIGRSGSHERSSVVKQAVQSWYRSQIQKDHLFDLQREPAMHCQG